LALNTTKCLSCSANHTGSYSSSGIYYFFHWLKSKKKNLDFIALFFALSAIGFAFLTHVKSTPIWLILKPLQYAQFPWRFIGLAGTMMIIFIIYTFDRFSNLTKSHFLVFVFSIFLIFRFLPFFKPEKFDNLTDQDFISGDLKPQQQQEHVFDYLPKTVHSLPDEFASSPIFRATEIPEFNLISWTSNDLTLEINNPLTQTLTFSVFSYPGWTMKLDGQKVPYHTHSNYGLIQKEIPAGKHVVSLVFSDTTLRLIANLISIVSLFIVAFYHHQLKTNS